MNCLMFKDWDNSQIIWFIAKPRHKKKENISKQEHYSLCGRPWANFRQTRKTPQPPWPSLHHSTEWSQPLDAWWVPWPALMWRKEVWDALALHNKSIPLLCVCVLSHATTIIDTHFYTKQENEYKYYILWVEFTSLDHFSHLKAGHLGWLFIFNNLYCYWNERKQLLVNTYLRGSESPSGGVCFCTLFRKGTKALRLD